MADEGPRTDEPPAVEPAPPPVTAGAPAPVPPTPREQPEHERQDTFQPLLYAKIAALLFVLAYSIAFVVGNRRSISIDFVFATANVSLIWSILLLLAVGLVGGVLLSQLYRHRRRQKLRKSGDSFPDLPRRDKAEGKSRSAPPT